MSQTYNILLDFEYMNKDMHIYRNWFEISAGKEQDYLTTVCADINKTSRYSRRHCSHSKERNPQAGRVKP